MKQGRRDSLTGESSNACLLLLGEPARPQYFQPFQKGGCLQAFSGSIINVLQTKFCESVLSRVYKGKLVV